VNLIELHILQSFPVTCLNRDDLGSPKSAIFGGANRARISSQCLKRAIRLTASQLNPDGFHGQRTRLIIDPLIERLTKTGVEPTKATDAAKEVAHALATLDDKAEKEGKLKVKTLMFLSPAELDAIAKALEEPIKAGAKTKELGKAAAKAAKGVALKDAADIAIFGRMVASDQSLTVEGAGMFSHALSTHKCENEIDFFAAVDDAQSRDEAGAGMTGTLEFNSATYYRYAALNVGLLNEHLPSLSSAQKRAITDAFIRAAVLSIPGARKNSMNGATLPSFVLGIVKAKGQPVQLVNAFERPVYSRNGIIAESIEALKNHYETLKKTWNITDKVTVAIPDLDLETFCARLLESAFPV
jgi:CRISPR system Cascade subunit CasC